MHQYAWVLLVLASVAADICPMVHHNTCNYPYIKHRCTCAMTLEEASAPEISCNKVVSVDDDDGIFPATSIQFTLDEKSSDLDEFPEPAFRDAIVNSLRIRPEELIIARVGCTGTTDTLLVQFVILKKNTNATLPYPVENFVDAKTITSKLKAMGHLTEIADLEVDKIEFVEKLIDIEHDPDNTVLMIQAGVVGALFGFMFLLGCCMLCRKSNDYNDELQK